MTDEEKFDYAITQIHTLCIKDSSLPYSYLDKEAFYYRLLLLRGPVDMTALPFGSLKGVLKGWLVSLKPYYMISVDDKKVITQMQYL